MTRLCDICGRPDALELVPSGCAPVTYSACTNCSSRGAENIDVAAMWWFLEGGSETAEAKLSSIISWKDGAYVGGNEVRIYTDANRDKMQAELDADNEMIDLPIDKDDEQGMTGQKFSERVQRALEAIETKALTRKGLRNFYDNAVREPNITDAEREAVIAALEKRIRITSPKDAKVLFGPKDAEARALLGRIHDALAGEFDLSGNMVGLGVKTGGDMISGENHVSVYISYKGADRRHATLGVHQKKPETDPVFVLRFYQTGSNATEQDSRKELPIDAVDEAISLYRANLMRILGETEGAVR